MQSIERGILVLTEDGYRAIVLERRGDALTIFAGNGLSWDCHVSTVFPLRLRPHSPHGEALTNFAEILDGQAAFLAEMKGTLLTAADTFRCMESCPDIPERWRRQAREEAEEIGRVLDRFSGESSLSAPARDAAATGAAGRERSE